MTNKRLFVDTGSELPVATPTATDRPRGNSTPTLHPVNSTDGLRSIMVDIGLRRLHRCVFVIADGTFSILGAVFLSQLNLDMVARDRRLKDNVTFIDVLGLQLSLASSGIRTLQPVSAYKILAEYSQVTKPRNEALLVKHKVTHRFTTTGPAVTARPPRLAKWRLLVARLKFEHMLQLGVHRPSSSN
ncbi:uncharacterized protein LOC142591531 [Dermacentor variabilis]|uniref:uncharacterized protein LOC142591531 n=1 Tax=Dermacentor variabilis TaxID=34621 RepID=UPI003F5B2FF3